MPGPGAFVIGEEERKQVDEVMATGHLSRYGRDDDPKFLRKVYTLEDEFAAYSGAAHCVATSSGTSSILV